MYNHHHEENNSHTHIASLFGKDKNSHTSDTLFIGLKVPADGASPKEWLNSVLESAHLPGAQTLHDVANVLDLPTHRMLVRPCHKVVVPAREPLDILLIAQILARTNEFRYLPDSQPIYTKNRLHRTLALSRVDIDSYYGLTDRIDETRGRVLDDGVWREANYINSKKERR